MFVIQVGRSGIFPMLESPLCNGTCMHDSASFVQTLQVPFSKIDKDRVIFKPNTELMQGSS